MRNANAILDSLMRYEVAKLRIRQFTAQRAGWQTERLGLEAESLQLRESVRKAQAAYLVADADLRKTRRRLFRANLERWAWRIAAAGLTYLILK
jgi:hypothetical protein